VKKKTSSSKLQEFHRLKEEAVAELLDKRKSLKQELRQEVARLEKALEENATELLELGHKVKDAGASSSAGKNLRLPNDQIKEQLRVLLTGKQLSIPSICQHLRIARSRFAAFDKENKGFLGSKGNGKATVYFLK
jgi:hypothetical protein